MTTRASEVARDARVVDPDDRSVRRRRKVLQAQHYRHQGRSIAEIARLLDQAPATIKAYLYDPTGDKARAIKQRYRGSCESCGAPTSGADGKGRASRHCQRCKPQSVPRWTRELVRAAHRRWYERYGFVASSYDWSWTDARRRGGAALARYESGDWPSGPVIRRLFGSAANARAHAFPSPAQRTDDAQANNGPPVDITSDGPGAAHVSASSNARTQATSRPCNRDGPPARHAYPPA